MISNSFIFSLIDFASALRHKDKAIQIKQSINDLEDKLKELKEEWGNLAAEEYAADRIFKEFDFHNFRDSGELIGYFRKGNFFNCQEYTGKWIEYKNEFKRIYRQDLERQKRY